MLVKYVDPVFRNKLLETPKEMRTLLPYLQQYYGNFVSWLYTRWKDYNEVNKQCAGSYYLVIQSMISYKMNKCNDIFVGNTQVLPSR